MSPRSSSRGSPEPAPPPGDVAQVGGSARLGAPRELLRGSKTLTLTLCSMDKELPVHTSRAPGSPGQLPPCTHRCPLPETSATLHTLLHSAGKEASSALPVMLAHDPPRSQPVCPPGQAVTRLSPAP